MNYINGIQKIEISEATHIAYVKVGNNSKNLIVSFASNNHDGFDMKTSLMELKFKRNDFDVLYLRNRGYWYLGTLNGIGTTINETIKFLTGQIIGYANVIFTGYSSGAFASILYGSLCKVDCVVAKNPQTDINWILHKDKCKLVGEINEADRPELMNLIQYDNEIKKKYFNLNKFINNTTNYFISCKRKRRKPLKDFDHVLHNIYHVDNILKKNKPNVKWLRYDRPFKLIVREIFK
jgi:hypothetical protein